MPTKPRTVAESPTLVIERVFLPSHIRRGRMATSPTFIVRTVGWVWLFQRRKDAQSFIDRGGECPNHGFLCVHCHGRREEASNAARAS